MSTVTNVILTTATFEGTRFCELVAALSSADIEAPVRVDQHGAIDKLMEASVYIGAYNYLDLDAFVRHVDSVAWGLPESVRLFVREHSDDHGFHEVHLPKCARARGV